MLYSVIDVAKYVIWYCQRREYSISNLKLQKILYFIQAEFLVSKGEPCFIEEIEAWDFGPVVPEAYHEFKVFGSSNIPAFVCKNADMNILDSDKEIIDEMVDQCSRYSAAMLVEITHNQDPWNDVYVKHCNNVISKESIKKYFMEK